ncbi:alpha/beta fold hydrolase [Ktedonospora formicarum]|uniref:Monoacylglycerol lipase n=1 Tax=Ktedonospora formicarum TaxID=2778364 RepID=A0A8J3I8H6_9CHLR|nr:alpha/beta fold hydrolase [Ktedonospora formicarum]GHO46629.1 monoacylglycerol lipase [Ktedonospora formicarum]
MLYQTEAPGDWGEMRATPGVRVGTEELTTPDGCSHFVRSWVTDAECVLLIMHGLGGHSAWYNDLGNVLSQQSITVYALDHRGFGRSGGMSGHIDRYITYVDDIIFVLDTIRQRHPNARLHLLGHSMGGLFAVHTATRYGSKLSSLILLNAWIQDTSSIPLSIALGIAIGGLMRSRRYWTVAADTRTMTTNPEAIQMLQADPLWGKRQTASMLFQVLMMRLAALGKASGISLPALVIQADDDAAVSIQTNRTLFERLASKDKNWKNYPDYHHDSQFEADRSQMDADLASWLHAHS